MIQTKHLETMAGTSGKKVALFKIKLFVSSFLATGSENCIFELSHKLDHLAKGVALRSFAPKQSREDRVHGTNCAIPHSAKGNTATIWYDYPLLGVQESAERPNRAWRSVEECGLLVWSFPYIAHPAKFYLPDLFHIYLAGFGQDHGASCLVYMLGTIFGGSSVEVQLGSLNVVEFYKRMHHVITHTYNFTRLVLNFLDGTMTYPTGTWSKAQWYCKNHWISFCILVICLYTEK